MLNNEMNTDRCVRAGADVEPAVIDRAVDIAEIRILE